jgi:hypothetical protein
MVTLLEPEKLSLIKQHSSGFGYRIRVAKAKGCQGAPTSKCTEVIAPHDIAVGVLVSWDNVCQTMVMVVDKVDKERHSKMLRSAQNDSQ